MCRFLLLLQDFYSHTLETLYFDPSRDRYLGLFSSEIRQNDSDGQTYGTKAGELCSPNIIHKWEKLGNKRSHYSEEPPPSRFLISTIDFRSALLSVAHEHLQWEPETKINNDQ